MIYYETWKSYEQDKCIKLVFLKQHKLSVPFSFRMDKLKLLIYQNGYRVSMKELYDKNWAFGTQVFLNRELHKIWNSFDNLGRSFEVEMNPEQENILVRCVQYYSRNSTLYTGKPGVAAFPREFVDSYLNKTMIYQHSPDVKIHIHIVEPDKDMVILTYSFGTLGTVIKSALVQINKQELQPELMRAIGIELMKMFQINKDDLLQSGFPLDNKM